MSDQESNSSGYESKGFQEYSAPSAPKESSTHQDQRGSYTGGNNYSSNNYRKNAGSQSGGFSRFGGNSRRNAPEVPRDFSVDPPIFYRPYVGTGNAEVPETALAALKEIRDILDQRGYTVRTSAFDGPDKMFMDAKHKEVIIPWRNFADSQSKLTFTSEEAMYFAKQFFPKFDDMKDTVKKFLAKNVRLVCGQNLKSLAQFVVVWTEDGCEDPKIRSPKTGNSSHVIAVAHHLNIPVFNFGKQDARERLLKYLHIQTP